MEKLKKVSFLLLVLFVVPALLWADSDDPLGAIRKAAEQGFEEAQTIMGNAYASGQGVPQDYVEAVKWWHLAAEQGDPFAQFHLGMAYGKGQGVPQDYVQAYMWLDVAGRLGNERVLALCDEIADLMTEDEIGKAQVLAKKWRAKPSTSK